MLSVGWDDLKHQIWNFRQEFVVYDGSTLAFSDSCSCCRVFLFREEDRFQTFCSLVDDGIHNCIGSSSCGAFSVALKCQKSGRINSKYWRDSFVFGSWKQDSWLSRVLFFHHMEMISFQTFATEFCVADVNEAPLRCLGYTHIMKLKHGWLIVCSSSRWFSFCSLSSLISQRNKLRFGKKDESFSIFFRF